MPVELTILMPCLNEAETLAGCIRNAHLGAQEAGVEEYEVLVADNGSTDGSPGIADAEGARVIHVPRRGYGAALQAGIEQARGRYVIMGDSDESYDFRQIGAFVQRLRTGDQLVMGTRLKGEIRPGAMPLLHRYLGNPVLTFLGNLLFRTGLSDFHCGLRGFDREAVTALGLRTTGMEFASEMVIRATLSGLKTSEIPIVYTPDRRSRRPHLRTWQDGWRHLRFMLLFSPRWVFIYPGVTLAVVSGLAVGILLRGPLRVGSVVFDVSSLLVASSLLIVGVQMVLFGVFARAYAARMGLLPVQAGLERFIDSFSLGAGLASGVGLSLLGVGVYAAGLLTWSRQGFGPLDYEQILRIMIPGMLLLVGGLQVFFSSFMLSLLGFR
jgi:glycosyltransferase involved in cell wall biosynthesis